VGFLNERGATMPPIREKEVVEAVASTGRWTHEEWRISTVTSTEISRTGEARRHRAYKVRVECDFVFEAFCPTITRAIEVAAVYERLVQQLWREIGWPGWASRRQLEPDADAV
jgi:hypothetical protein